VDQVNVKQTVELIAFIKSLCPSQKFEEATHRAWAMVLNHTDFRDAQAAVSTIYKTQGSDTEWVRRIEADDIIREVARHKRAMGERAITCDTCGQTEQQCRKAQENQLRIFSEVQARHGGGQLKDDPRHDFRGTHLVAVGC
jgi:hypothetical protein